jgi:hypothetical protein
MLLVGVVLATTGCGPGAAEGLLQAYLGVVGPIIGVGVLLLILLGGIPRA